MKNSLMMIFFALILACSDKRGDHRIVPRIFKWENGKIKAEEYFLDDSIKEGLFKRYYSSGKLQAETNYHLNKLNGWSIKYFENGKKEMAIFYTEGLPVGAGIGYYENGVIKWYQVYNSLFNPKKGKVGFEIDYKEDGGIKQILGTPVIEYSANRDTLAVGDTLKINFTVATPPKSNTLLSFYEDFPSKKNLKVLQVNTRECTSQYLHVVDKKGVINWGGIYIITFDSGPDLKFKFQGVSLIQ